MCCSVTLHLVSLFITVLCNKTRKLLQGLMFCLRVFMPIYISIAILYMDKNTTEMFCTLPLHLIQFSHMPSYLTRLLMWSTHNLLPVVTQPKYLCQTVHKIMIDNPKVSSIRSNWNLKKQSMQYKTFYNYLHWHLLLVCSDNKKLTTHNLNVFKRLHSDHNNQQLYIGD